MESSINLNNTKNSPPLSFKLAKWLQNREIRGGNRLENFCCSKGYWNTYVNYAITPSVSIDVPIATRPYDFRYITQYEIDSIDFISNLLPNYNNDFTLIDCGADIGLMTARLVSECPQIKEAIEFEPNPNSFLTLKNNSKLLGINARPINKAVSDFSGKAKLITPEFDSHDHAAYIVPDEAGEIEVTSIDDLSLSNSSNILLKIDVEGAELSVIRGALDTLKNADQFVIIFEAHYRQVDRTKIDPTEIISLVNQIQPTLATVVEIKNSTINLNTPFYEQFPKEILNICIYSKSKR